MNNSISTTSEINYVAAACMAENIDTIVASGNAASLLPFLSETFSGYNGRSTNEVVHLKGYALAAFSITGTPEEALPYILDELENGMDAYIVTAAALSMRSMTRKPVTVTSYLVKAFYNMLHKEDAVSFTRFEIIYPLTGYTTPLTEILQTMCWLDQMDEETLKALKDIHSNYSEAISRTVKILLQQIIEGYKPHVTVAPDCCSYQGSPILKKGNKVTRIRKDKLSEIQLEDQDFRRFSFNDFFLGSYTVVIFFYTRCDNPNKCPLSISLFAQLKKLLSESGLPDIQLAAISYDGDYDTPLRLKNYGINKGFQYDDKSRFIRVVSGYDTLKEYLNIKVNYTGSIVNTHTIELYILNKEGTVIASQNRLQWAPVTIIHTLKELQKSESQRVFPAAMRFFRIAGNVTGGILLAFFPKCPVCWAGYMSLLGAVGLQSIPYTPELFFVILFIMALSLQINFRISRRKKRLPVFCLNLMGCLAVISGYTTHIQTLTYVGIGLLVISSLYLNLADIFMPRLSQRIATTPQNHQPILI